MNDYTLAIVVGRLRKTPKLKYTKPAGIPFVRMDLSIRRTSKDETTGESKTVTGRVTVEVWRRLAELCAQFLKKGRPIMVVGSLNSLGTGQIITADRVQFLGAKETEEVK